MMMPQWKFGYNNMVVAQPKELIVNSYLTCKYKSQQRSSGADDICWGLHLKVRSSFESVGGPQWQRAGTKSGLFQKGAVDLGPHCLSLFFCIYLDYF